jgi:hypothetical protein
MYRVPVRAVKKDLPSTLNWTCSKFTRRTVFHSSVVYDVIRDIIFNFVQARPRAHKPPTITMSNLPEWPYDHTERSPIYDAYQMCLLLEARTRDLPNPLGPPKPAILARLLGQLIFEALPLLFRRYCRAARTIQPCSQSLKFI